MTAKKRALGSDLAKLDAHVIQPEEYDEIPELTEEWFKDARWSIGRKPISEAEGKAAFRDGIRRGRPPSDSAKKLVSLRLSPEVIAHFRASGPGWQTRINDTLLAAANRKRRGR